MAPQDKKWDDAAQRDLCLAIITSSQDGDRFRINWGPIVETMHSLGYSFTKDAVSQQFTKVLIKDFKSRQAQGAGQKENGSGEVTPKATPRKRAPNKTGGAASKKRARGGDEHVNGYDAGDGESPAKRIQDETEAGSVE